MALTLIPAIDLRGGRCVRLLQGRLEDETVFSEDPVDTARSWQAHSVRGFISGGLTKKMGIKIESFKSEDKERAYRVAQ